VSGEREELNMSTKKRKNSILEKGGFTERLTKARSGARRHQWA